MKRRTIVIGVTAYTATVASIFFFALRTDAVGRGYSHLNDGEYSEAVAEFTEALGSDPDDLDAYLGRAEALIWLDPEAALTDYDVVVERLRGTDDRRLAKALAGRGGAWLSFHDMDQALRDYEAASELPAADHRTFFRLALVRVATDDAEGALEAAEEALRRAPSNVSDFRAALLVQTRAIARWETGDREGCLEDLNRAVDQYPSADNHLVRATYYARMERFEAAEADLTEALRLDPAHQRSRTYRGELLRLQGEYARADAVLTDVVADFPDDPEPLNQLARLLATCPDASVRDGARAVELSRRAVEASGMRTAAILDTVAAAHAEAGLWDEAVAFGQQAVELSGKKGRNGIAARLELYRARTPYREP